MNPIVNSLYGILPVRYVKKAEPIVKSVTSGVPVSVFGLSGGERMHLASELGNFFVYVVTDHLTAKSCQTQLSQLCGCVPYLPANIDVLTYSSAKSNSLRAERQKAIFEILSGRARGVVVTVDALCQIMCKKADWLGMAFTLNTGAEYPHREVSARLVETGYARVGMVESRGQWSLRGDILDIFPVQSEYAVRIEFFGETVETIRILDIDTQKSTGTLTEVNICPASAVCISPGETEEVLKKLKKDMPKNLPAEKEERYKRITAEIEYKLNSKIFDSSMEFVLPFTAHTLLSEYLPENTVIVYDECKALYDQLLNTLKEHRSRYSQLLTQGEVCLSSIKQFVSAEEMKDSLKGFKHLAFHRITGANTFFEPEELYNFTVSPIAKYQHNYREFSRDVSQWLKRGYRVLIAGRDEAGCKGLKTALEEEKISAGIGMPDDRFWASAAPLIRVMPFELERGFSYHDDKYIVVGTNDIFTRRSTHIRSKQARSLFLQPNVGDYVVHSVHGIGRCDGIQRIKSSMGLKDYVVIIYRDGDKLYVPIDQMDMLSKFSGSEARLSKMGGEEFSKAKERAAKSIKTMAVDLLKLYSQRERTEGYRYNIDENTLKEFVDSFEFISTPDQLAAQAEILTDMKSGKIMDRLLVGDVGYGKTEVALRAAFAAILNGRQVVMLAPTTILSQQHFLTACKRFEKFGVRVGVLNRFCSAKQQSDTIEKLKEGKLDFVCGTHRLLSKDVGFKDLGLLILDEEQRFGVSDKEKIKALKATVDVLTMTATPIPRTLHMSMSGIRDISTLENPPSDRLPVQTFVTEYSEGLAADIINRELTRGGQVFVVYNRVETIDRFTHRMRQILPGVRIIVAHGQMTEAYLENNIKDFYDGQAEVLISTTIIENGIDLANANTLLVVDADRLGLSQLYQLRGRVGRSNRLAYAYFTYNTGKEITEAAFERLNTLMEFTEFGSGFKIAMRDLEIRGAGNVLGREQHGHMEKVGYDLYSKLLAEEIARLKGETNEMIELECRIDIDTDAYIPSSYISDDDGRMRLYSRIATLRSMSDREQLIFELKDIYGAPPKPLLNLINVGLYKGFGVKINAEQIKISAAGGEIRLRHLSENILRLINDHSDQCVLKMSKMPTIAFNQESASKPSVYERMFNFLCSAAESGSSGDKVMAVAR